MSIKTVLISQPKPTNGNSPYSKLVRKHKIKVDYRPFIHVEGLTAKEEKADSKADEEEEEELIEPSLKPEEALTLIRAVRSLDNRRFAWRWLQGQLQAMTARDVRSIPLINIQDTSVQRALLQWGSASCDQAGLGLLKRITQGELGFSAAMMRSARVAQTQVERCVALQKGRVGVERWLEERLK